MAEPQWSAIVKDIVTSAAVMLGGVWAAWKWGYGETLRRRREMPSPDGTLTATSVPIDDTTTAVTLNAIWRNRGPLPIELCAAHSVVEAFKLSNSLPKGNLILLAGKEIESIAVVKPMWNVYVLEPNTDSVITEHFVLDRNYVYGFKWTICVGQLRRYRTRSTSHFICTRELLWRPDLDAVG